MAEISGRATARKAAAVQDELLADGSMVLYHAGTQRIVTLNPTAALIWEYCDGAHTASMIAGEVRAVFPDATAPEEDVLRLLRDLREQEMIIMGDPGA
jgi:hypothetical protein